MSESIGEAPFESLYDLDVEERKKVGPYSIMLPWNDRVSDMDAYFDQRYNGDEAALEYAFSVVSQILPSNIVVPVEFTVSYGLMPADTNLGLPIFTRNRGDAQLYLQRALSLRDASELYPAVVGWRGQPNGTIRPKQRIVWMIDHAETIIGGTIMHPLLSALRVHDGFAAWNTPDDVDVAITRIMKKAQGRKIYSGDYSGFDSSVPRELIAVAFAIIRQWLVPGFEERLSVLEEAFATMPIAVPYHIKDGRSGGVPSGSVLTNLVDSLINLLVAHYVAFRAGCTVEDIEVLGDDLVVLYSDEISPSELEDFASEVGMKMNAEKQHISATSVHYLQRLYDVYYERDGVYPGVRSPFRAASGFTGMERFKKNWTRWRATARFWVQLEQCHYDPRFESLIRFAVDADDNLRQRIGIVEIFKRAGGAEQVRSDLDKASFAYGVVDPEGVAAFDSTRIYNDLV
jgi:hypothetical protein